MSSPAELVDKDCCFNAGDIGLIEGAGISAVIFPLDMKEFGGIVGGSSANS